MIERLLNPIKARIRLMVGKCIVTACRGKTVDISLLAEESREGVDFYQQFGFSSYPTADVSGVALFIGGSRDNGVVVATRGDDSTMRVNLEPGEIAVHSPYGSKILLKKDGSISVTTDSKKIRFVGDVEVTGDVKANCDSAFVSLTGHIHATGVGPSDAPTPGK